MRSFTSTASYAWPVNNTAQKGLPFIPDEVLVEKMLPNFGYQVGRVFLSRTVADTKVLQLWWKTDEAADILEKNVSFGVRRLRMC